MQSTQQSALRVRTGGHTWASSRVTCPVPGWPEKSYWYCNIPNVSLQRTSNSPEEPALAGAPTNILIGQHKQRLASGGARVINTGSSLCTDAGYSCTTRVQYTGSTYTCTYTCTYVHVYYHGTNGKLKVAMGGILGSCKKGFSACSSRACWTRGEKKK